MPRRLGLGGPVSVVDFRSLEAGGSDWFVVGYR